MTCLDLKQCFNNLKLLVIITFKLFVIRVSRSEPAWMERAVKFILIIIVGLMLQSCLAIADKVDRLSI